jgi:hypothetical protein
MFVCIVKKSLRSVVVRTPAVYVYDIPGTSLNSLSYQARRNSARVVSKVSKY